MSVSAGGVNTIAAPTVLQATRPAGAVAPTLRREFAWTLAALLALVLWEFSGWDTVVAGWYGTTAGFRWRDAWWARALLYDGGRLVAALLLIGMAVHAARRIRPDTPTRSHRLLWLGVSIASLLLAPVLKHMTLSSCPWDLALFGGHVPYVPHWRLDLVDGGPGRCFPSGHAVSGFAFFSLYFLWRPHDARLARRWLLLVLTLGAVAGWTQLLRGAHFPSHTLWSGWLCWTLAVTAAGAASHRSRWRARRDDGVAGAGAAALDAAAAAARPAVALTS